MAQKKDGTPAKSGDTLKQATDAAASMLLVELEAVNEATLESLRDWRESSKDPEFELHHIKTVVRLAQVSAQLGQALARMRAESRQHISVERLAAPPEPASIEKVLSTRKALKQRANSKRSQQIEGEGGGGE